jgi:photosynthetic reaction center cytochrome c subunit
MKLGSMRSFLGATAIAVAGLVIVAVGSRVPVEASAQAAQGGGAAAAPGVTLTDDVFKTVVLLRGIPVDTFFEAMGMFANAMGNDCTFCHASKAYFDKREFATPTPRLQRARQMIVMMNAINKQYFGGQPRVTCFTCHQGSDRPVADPNIMLQYATPVEDPNVRDIPVDTRLKADEVFDKYLQALGGKERLSKFTGFTAKGTYAGFDTSFDKVPMELYAKAPGQQAMVVHFFNGDSHRVYDGTNGWMAGPDTPLPLLTLTAGNLDRVRLEALAPFGVGLRTTFPQWRVGRTAINDKEVIVVQGLRDNRVLANFYFDETGLLVRMNRWTETPVGFVPTVIDLEDYRDVGGIKMPFKKTVSQTYMQMVVELTNVQPNVQIPDSRFARPAPAKPPA